MRINTTLFSLLVLVSLCSCHRYYTSSSFAEKTAKHKIIAVLPPQLVHSGVIPRNLTRNDLMQVEEKESRIFQESLYNNLLKRANTRRYEMQVSIQPYVNTLAILEKNNISVRDSWTKDDKDLCALLNVDAVVRTSIQKERYMSDLASAGIDAGKKILDAVLNKPVLLPVVTNKTHDIRVTCSLVSNGEALWNDSYKRESNYNSPATEIIENLTNNFAKHFPYRRKA